MSTPTKYKRVQVMFGSHVIVDNVLPAGEKSGQADWFAAKIGRRYAGLPVHISGVTTADLAKELAR